MKNKLSFLLIAFLTFSVFANTSSTIKIKKSLAYSKDNEIISVSSNKHKKNYAILQKANLNEASFFQVAGIYPTCQQCTNDLYHCKALASNQSELGECFQEYVDCREICTRNNPWDF